MMCGLGENPLWGLKLGYRLWSCVTSMVRKFWSFWLQNISKEGHVVLYFHMWVGVFVTFAIRVGMLFLMIQILWLWWVESRISWMWVGIWMMMKITSGWFGKNDKVVRNEIWECILWQFKRSILEILYSCLWYNHTSFISNDWMRVQEYGSIKYMKLFL